MWTFDRIFGSGSESKRREPVIASVTVNRTGFPGGSNP